MSKLHINKVLVIDRSTEFRRILLRFFSQHFPSSKVREYDPKKGCPDNTFPWHEFDLLIINFTLETNGNGIDWLRTCKTNAHFPAIILTTDKHHGAIAINAFRYGVHDYLNKNELSIPKLKDSIYRAINKHADEIGMDDRQLLQGKLINMVKLHQKLDDVHENGALLLVSIDNYHDIHNKIGLIPADELTSHLSEILVKSSASIKCSSIEIIRVNNNSIAMIILDAKNDDVYTKYSEELCTIIAESTFQHKKETIDYHTSIGIVFLKESTRGAKTNISCADAAVQLAQENSENSHVVFGGNIQHTNVTNQKLALHIQNSIKENRIQPFFQPIIGVSEATEIFDPKIYQFRTKLIDLNGQLLNYNDFLPILRQKKLVKNLDYWVIRHVIDRLHTIKDEKQEKSNFLVPLEEESLLNEGLVKWIEQLTDYFKDPALASSLMLEIRSEYFIILEKYVINMVMELRNQYGVSFALTNVHGLSILKKCTQKISFEFIKIPMYETSNQKEKSIDIDELSQMIESSREQGSLIIVDKIDNADYLSTAIECSTDFVSGYLVHPPQENISSTNEVVM